MKPKDFDTEEERDETCEELVKDSAAREKALDEIFLQALDGLEGKLQSIDRHDNRRHDG